MKQSSNQKTIEILSLLPNLRGEHNELHFHNQEGEVYKGDVLSETKVLKSNAGYYIGHEYQDRDFENAYLPYDRISGYYATRPAAEMDLELYKKALGH
jgi:hypothetical protein